MNDLELISLALEIAANVMDDKAHDILERYEIPFETVREMQYQLGVKDRSGLDVYDKNEWREWLKERMHCEN